MKILFNVYFILFLMTTHAAKTQKRKRNFQIILTKVHCDVLTPKIRSFECFRSFVGQFSAANAKVVLDQDLPNITAHVTCTIMRKNQRNFVIVDTILDVCKFFDYNVKGGLLQVFSKQFQTVSVNLKDGCPLRKNIVYEMKDFVVDGSFFPPFSPDLNYTIFIDIYNSAERFATMEIIGCLTQKNKKTKP